MQHATELTPAMLSYWRNLNPIEQVFAPPSDMPTDCLPATGLITFIEEIVVVRVPWLPNEIDLAHLAQGGVVWLSTWGGLPPHQLEVQPAR